MILYTSKTHCKHGHWIIGFWLAHQFWDQLNQHGGKSVKGLKCPSCMLSSNRAREVIFNYRSHTGAPFANHFVPLCHTHLPCCQCPTASGEVTAHFTWQEEIIYLRTADRSFEWWTPEQFLQQRIIWNSIGINKVAADTRPDLAHAHAHGVTPTSFSRKAPVGGSGGGGRGGGGGGLINNLIT